MDKKEWEPMLAPFAEAYGALDRTIMQAVAAASDDELVTMRTATMMPTAGNCWYATFSAAKMLRAEIDGEQYRRRTKAALTDSAPAVP